MEMELDDDDEPPPPTPAPMTLERMLEGALQAYGDVLWAAPTTLSRVGQREETL